MGTTAAHLFLASFDRTGVDNGDTTLPSIVLARNNSGNSANQFVRYNNQNKLVSHSEQPSPTWTAKNKKQVVYNITQMVRNNDYTTSEKKQYRNSKTEHHAGYFKDIMLPLKVIAMGSFNKTVTSWENLATMPGMELGPSVLDIFYANGLDYRSSKKIRSILDSHPRFLPSIRDSQDYILSNGQTTLLKSGFSRFNNKIPIRSARYYKAKNIFNNASTIQGGATFNNKK